MAAAEPTTADAKRKPNEEKWGDALRQGFVVVPWVLLRRQKELDLDPLEMVVLLHLLASWWEVNKAPYPRSQTIAKRMDVSVRTVQRCLRKLEDKGYLRRRASTGDKGGAVTSYDLTPLAAKLTEVVHQSIHDAQVTKKEDSFQSVELV